MRKYNPDLKCCEPPYEFCEYPDGEYKERDVLIRHVEAVAEMGVDRECYIDGIWNKESVEDWLTEVQLPIE